MKKGVSIMRLMGIILMCGFVFSLYAVEQQKAEAQAKATSSGNQVVTTSSEKLMEGMVVSIDKTKQSFVVKLKGKDYDFIVDGATIITINGEKKSFEELSKGSAVRVNYVKDNKGVRIAKSITQNVAIKKNKECKTQTSTQQPPEYKKSEEAQKSVEKQQQTAQPSTATKAEKKPAEDQQVSEQKPASNPPQQQSTVQQAASQTQTTTQTQKTVEQEKSQPVQSTPTQPSPQPVQKK
ncbi:MAG: hypothetical protein N2053_02360 [Chitinispirillaceae bacterium]|nr:hypothetical protein [Chitinispirillaceae bacterium]